jgi:large subunit ribosomal protein L21
MAKTTETYAVISVGGKQYRVREGEYLLVDRLPVDEGKTFHPDLLLLGGDGDAKFGEGELKGAQVTAKVAAHVLGEKVIVGKHKRRTGYRRRNGHRSRLSKIEIQTIGKKAARASAAAKPAAAKPAAAKQPAAKKPAARSKKTEEKK